MGMERQEREYGYFGESGSKYSKENDVLIYGNFNYSGTRWQ